jgi:hypothetical protein
MATPPIPRDEALRRLAAIERALEAGKPPPGIGGKGEGAIAAAWRELGINANRSPGLLERMEKAAGRKVRWDLYRGPGARQTETAVEARFIPPHIPAAEMPVGELIDKLKTNFTRRAAHADAKKWMKFTLKEDGPYCLAFVGDPHLDDNGCNWPLLDRDVALMRLPHVHGIGMGDYTNNWAGKLQRIYAHQDVTRDQAWKLAEWFFGEVPWMLLLKGNHDLWSDSHGQGDPLDWMRRGAAPLEPWQARFEVATPSGHRVRVWAAHDFKGHSMYNPLHGPMRAQRFSDGTADILAAGDEHHWELFHGEDAEKGTPPYWLVRTRGYKFLDPHADRLQYAPQQHGATIAAVVDPGREGPAAVQCYADLAEAIDYLKFKRSRRVSHVGASKKDRRV